MKSFVVESPKLYGIIEKEIPQPTEEQVLIRVKSCSICASDFEVLYGLNEEEVVYPITPGHVWSGDVVAAGRKYKKFVGKRVTGNNLIPCKRCGPCRIGRFEICKNKKELGFSLDGAYAEFIILPGENVVVLPDNVGYETASLTEPLAVSLHALNIAGKPKGSRTIIIGDGSIGLLALIIARRFGFDNLIVAGHHQNRLQFAKKISGAETVNTKNASLSDAVQRVFGEKADLIFEASGNCGAVSESLSLLEYGGTVCLLGNYRGGKVPFNPNDVMLHQQTITGSVSYSQEEMEDAVRLFGEGLLNEIDIITHVFNLEDFKQAFETVEERRENVIKVCFKI